MHHLATEGQETDACSRKTSLRSLCLSGSLCFCWNSIAWQDRILRAPCERHVFFVSCHAPAIFGELYPRESDGCLTCQASCIWNEFRCFHSTNNPIFAVLLIYTMYCPAAQRLCITPRDGYIKSLFFVLYTCNYSQETGTGRTSLRNPTKGHNHASELVSHVT